ncbi:unnamed protein product [Moneuplotes crassus]|uniref:Uncharacterized protein n=1 Tax=Euplotes crassus TaxID=5936 RepID=A0AAD1U9Q7_EUPCR|nr:unnamed protein product [Moneuplotes crassus]
MGGGPICGCCEEERVQIRQGQEGYYVFEKGKMFSKYEQISLTHEDILLPCERKHYEIKQFKGTQYPILNPEGEQIAKQEIFDIICEIKNKRNELRNFKSKDRQIVGKLRRQVKMLIEEKDRKVQVLDTAVSVREVYNFSFYSYSIISGLIHQV